MVASHHGTTVRPKLGFKVLLRLPGRPGSSAAGEKRFGPDTSEDLRDYVTQGRLVPEDLLWKEGLAEPVKAGKVGNLRFEARGTSGKSDPAVTPVENASRLVDIPRITRPEPRQEPRPESNDLLDNLEVIEEAHAGDKSLRKKRSKKKAQVGAGGAIALAMGRGISSLGEFSTTR